MALHKPYLDIPGTIIFDAEQSRKGYGLNQFCMSLMKAENRARFKADEKAYLDEWPMTEEQKQAVMARDLNWCMRTGGNIYFLAKIGATDGKSFQQMAGSMTGMTEDEYRDMMVKGGRSPEGNRYLGEDGDAQPQHQPHAEPALHVHGHGPGNPQGLAVEGKGKEHQQRQSGGEHHRPLRHAAPGQQAGILEHEGDRPAAGLRLAHPDGAGAGPDEVGDHPEQRRLADAGGADDRQELARRDVEVEAGEHRGAGAVAGEGEGEALDRDQARHRSIQRWRAVKAASNTP